MNTATVFNVQRFSLDDGPGIRTTVFLKGCPLRCSWCHNPESMDPRPEPALRPDLCLGCEACVPACRRGLTGRLDADTGRREHGGCDRCGACVEACPSEARSMYGRLMNTEQLVAEVTRDHVYYGASGGGVTFSGGEPLAAVNAAFVLTCLAELRRRGVRTAVDTCGHVDTDSLVDAARLVDLVLYDLKIMDDAEHRRLCGVGTGRIHANLRTLAKLDVETRVRVPLVPGLTDGEENLAAVARFVADLPRQPAVQLLPHHAMAADKYGRLGRAYELAGAQTPDPGEVARAARLIASHGLNVVRGV